MSSPEIVPDEELNWTLYDLYIQCGTEEAATSNEAEFD